MFDQDDYYSEEQDNLMLSNKNVPHSKVLVPSSGSDFNHLAGQGDTLMKMMKDRGLDLTENEMKKLKQPKNKQKSQPKAKSKAGFFDGGDKASVDQLIKALNKAFSQADPQQASCILSYILEKKGLSVEHRNKFSIMKCNILFGLGAYEDCLSKAQQFLQKSFNKLSASIYSNLMAKCKSQTNKILSGYMDFLRAKSLLEEYKQQLGEQTKQKSESTEENDQVMQKSVIKQKDIDDYAQSQIDTTARQINHTQLEYNIKMGKYKNNTNLIFPYFPQFRHRKILQVVCGDYHTLFLVGGALGDNSKENNLWGNEVFGFGENTVGQITGRQRKIIYKQPVLISQLSGKGIQGIWATRESSLAYDSQGRIYQWGIKQKRNQYIQVTHTIGQQISKLEKGYRHYAVLAKSGKFYSWGFIQMKGAPIYNQQKPSLQQSKNIINFSCGNSHIIAVNSDGQAFALGSNDLFQLGMPSEKLSKTFKKIDTKMLGDIQKSFCVSDCTFLVNTDNEVYFCGRYSLKKQLQERFRQAQFGNDFRDIVSITGSVGTYYVTSQQGICFKWDVDTMVKFKVDRQNQNITQRYVEACRGTVLKVRSMIKPEFCKVVRQTKQLKTYEPIQYVITLKDQFGLYGVSDLIIPPKCQIFLSTYRAKKQDVLKENKLFLQSHNFCTSSNKLLLNQIIQNRLLQFQITRDQQQPWISHLKISVENSGRYYFYIVIQEVLVLEEELQIQVSQRQRQLEEKNKQTKLLKQQQRKRRAELQRQRLAQQKLRKQMEEDQRRKQTQRRAEQALKRHLRQQQQTKQRQQQDRKARKELMTGGGFDLTKLKKKNSSQLTTSGTLGTNQKLQRSQKFQKTGQSFLPDINQRPSSRKKTTLPRPSQILGFRQKPLLKAGVADFSSTGFSVNNSNSGINQRPMTPKQKQLQMPQKLTVLTTATVATLKGTSQPKTTSGIVKRGLSKKKN